MANKKNPGYDKVFKLFMEDINDTENQIRYESFERNVRAFKDRYNELVPIVNRKIEEESILQTILVHSAKLGFLNEDAVNGLKEKEIFLKENIQTLNDYKASFESDEALMKKYRENSENKLFMYWKTLKALNPEVKPWLEWKTQYQNRIF